MNSDYPTLPGNPDDFREVQGFPGYIVSRSGEIYSCLKGRWAHGKYYSDSWRKLRPQTGKNNRPRVYMYRGSSKTRVRVQVAHITLNAFIGPKPDGMECLHADDNPLNNNINNLSWGTKAENEQQKTDKGRRPRGSQLPQAKLNEQQVTEIRQKLAAGATTTATAKEYNVSQALIWKIKAGNYWKDVGA